MKNRKVYLIILLIVFMLCLLLGIYGYFNKNSEVKSESLKEYYNLKEIEHEKITKEEFEDRYAKYNATDGESGISPFEEKTYVAYIKDGVAHYMTTSQICEGESCTVDEENYDVYIFSNIKNVKKIISKVDQKQNLQFAILLENNDVYYFTPLFDEITVDGKKYDAHLIKVNLPAQLDSFTNIANGQIAYGTDIVLNLKNNEKYILDYSYQTNMVSLMKYNDYVKKYLNDSNTIDLYSSIETIPLSNIVLESEKLNSIINLNNFVSENYNDMDYDNGSILPNVKVNIDGKITKFTINEIANPSALLYLDNDGSDGRMITVYAIESDGNGLKYTRFFAIDHEDPKNHSAETKKYNIDNIESMSLITITSDKEMLTNDKTPLTPTNYIIFKTKDGKYYTDYNIDNNYKAILREVAQK